MQEIYKWESSPGTGYSIVTPNPPTIPDPVHAMQLFPGLLLPLGKEHGTNLEAYALIDNPYHWVAIAPSLRILSGQGKTVARNRGIAIVEIGIEAKIAWGTDEIYMAVIHNGVILEQTLQSAPRTVS